MGAFLMFIGFAAVGLFLWWFSDTQTKMRALRASTRVDIADYPDGGHFRIMGRLSVDGDAMLAPITGRPCAAYEVIVEEEHDGTWHEVMRDSDAIRFVLTDETGRAHIDPDNATLIITKDSDRFSGTLEDPDDRQLAFLAKHRERDLFNRFLRYREGVLELDERVAVYGQGFVTQNPPGYGDHKGGYRTPAAKRRLDIRDTAEVQLMISDDISVLNTP